jgi:hypothetical protein
MSRAILPKFRDTWRTVCTVEQRWGDGVGAAVLTLRMKAGNTAHAPHGEVFVLRHTVSRGDLP